MVYFLTTPTSVAAITLLIKSPDPPSKVHPILRVPVLASLSWFCLHCPVPFWSCFAPARLRQPYTRNLSQNVRKVECEC